MTFTIAAPADSFARPFCDVKISDAALRQAESQRRALITPGAREAPPGDSPRTIREISLAGMISGFRCAQAQAGLRSFDSLSSLVFVSHRGGALHSMIAL